MPKTIQKLLPPAPNTAEYPTGLSFSTMVAWREGAAAQDALNKNTQLAAEWLNQFTGTWLVNYNSARYPYDAVPPAPPVQQYAYITETTEDTGFLTIDYALVDDPRGGLVCSIPAFKRMPPPSTGQSLMQKLVDEGTPGGQGAVPTIPIVPVNQMSKASDGSVWVRVA